MKPLLTVLVDCLPILIELLKNFSSPRGDLPILDDPVADKDFTVSSRNGHDGGFLVLGSQSPHQLVPVEVDHVQEVFLLDGYAG